LVALNSFNKSQKLNADCKRLKNGKWCHSNLFVFFSPKTNLCNEQFLRR
jgi:hypothetical protein